MCESEVAQSCPTLSNAMDCSLPGSSAHGIFHYIQMYTKIHSKTYNYILIIHFWIINTIWKDGNIVKIYVLYELHLQLFTWYIHYASIHSSSMAIVGLIHFGNIGPFVCSRIVTFYCSCCLKNKKEEWMDFKIWFIISNLAINYFSLRWNNNNILITEIFLFRYEIFLGVRY